MFLYMEKWQDPTIAALSALLILFAFALVVGTLLVSRGTDLRRILPR
jgi:putative spermidine/putrescine transport system permease protein